MRRTLKYDPLCYGLILKNKFYTVKINGLVNYISMHFSLKILQFMMLIEEDKY